MKKTIYILLILTVIFSFSYAKPEGLESSRPIVEGFWDAGLPPAAQTAWESTVQTRFIWMLITKKHLKEKVGSGVIVDLDPGRRKALIVTTLHNIEDKDGQPSLYRKIKILFPGEPGNRSQIETFYPSKRVSIVITRPDKDLAYLSVEYPKKAQPAIASFKSIDNDVTVPGNLIAIGFPNLSSNRKKIIKRFSAGKFLFKTLGKNNVHLLAHNAKIWKGNSGGPLVDNNGRVIGLNALIAYQTKISVKNPRYFYAAICVSEMLDDIEYINKNKLW